MKYYCFYTYAYGLETRREEYDDLSDVIALVHKANELDSPYRDFIVVEGTKLEFEPASVVETWRIKQAIQKHAT